MEDRIPQSAVDGVAQHISERNSKSYNIPVVGTPSNAETPQVFEIIPFQEMDKKDIRVYAIDGSHNSHSFYNGVSIGLYRGGYVCFESGKQIRMNTSDDPVFLGKTYTPSNILVTCDAHLHAIYDELLNLPPVKDFVAFLDSKPEHIFAYKKELICQSLANLLSFSQEILEWSLIYKISNRAEIKPGDYILTDGTLRS